MIILQGGMVYIRTPNEGIINESTIEDGKQRTEEDRYALV
jgi:hypothetical protein